MLELVEQLHCGDVRQIAAGLFDATDSFGQGQEQDDDQTLVVIKGAAS
jgi:sigma-B regulation protein RsbU (phosphoserine phosphatase)